MTATFDRAHPGRPTSSATQAPASSRTRADVSPAGVFAAGNRAAGRALWSAPATRSAGVQACTQVQRTVSGPSGVDGSRSGRLEAAAEQRALAHYRRHADDWPPETCQQARAALDLDPQGGLDLDLVRAVAGWQAGQGLAVDGILGYRSLAQLAPTGLRQADVRHQFSGDVWLQVVDRWPALGTAERRAAVFTDLADARIRAALPADERTALPRLGVDLTIDNALNSRFDRVDWKLRFNPRLWAAADEPGVYRALSYGVYAARQAEHAIALARSHAWTQQRVARPAQEAAATVAERAEVPTAVAAYALRFPLPPDSLAGLAAQVLRRNWDRLGSPGYRVVVDATIRARQRRDKALAAHRAAPADPTLRRRFERAQDAYRQQRRAYYDYADHEADADDLARRFAADEGVLLDLADPVEADPLAAGPPVAPVGSAP